MERYLNILDESQPKRDVEEYLGAFDKSLKMILRLNPIDRIGQSVLLAAKTALRIKASMPQVKEHEIAGRLKEIARNIRLLKILNELTPEEKRILKLHPSNKKCQPLVKSKRKTSLKTKPKVKKNLKRKRV